MTTWQPTLLAIGRVSIRTGTCKEPQEFPANPQTTNLPTNQPANQQTKQPGNGTSNQSTNQPNLATTQASQQASRPMTELAKPPRKPASQPNEKFPSRARPPMCVFLVSQTLGRGNPNNVSLGSPVPFSFMHGSQMAIFQASGPASKLARQPSR